MSFTFQSWKENLKKHLEGWRGRMKKSGIKSIYAFVSASALWPVIQAVSGGEWAAIAELGKLISGLGSSLLANKLQDWKDKTETEIASQIKNEVENNQGLRAELDELLDKLNALPLARETINRDDHKWFEETLRKELNRLGNIQKFETLIKDSNIQGQEVFAVGNVGGDLNVKIDKSRKKIYIHSKDQITTAPETLRDEFLNRLFQQCRQLSLAGIDPKAASSEAEARLKLDAVYTALLTLTPEAHERLLRSESFKKQTHRQSALEQLNKHSRLVLLGDPGSGKSIFVNFVALCLSGELLGLGKTNLDLLKSPLPEEDEEEREQQPWDHGSLIPIRIILRDFAARGLPSANEKATAVHLWNFIKSELESATLEKYSALLQQELHEKGGILLLDGLDEVPEAEQRRTQIKQAVEDFANSYRNCRIMVTSRTYAYQKQDWHLSGFSETILAPFSNGQIHSFIEHWYNHVAETRGINKEDASGRAEQLKHAISGSYRLRALAERPLLLTLMASLHAWRGGNLPEKREELYADTVDLLLDWWESPKTVREADGIVKVLQPSLAEWLKVDKDKVRDLLNELAFKAHVSQLEIIGTADISEGDLVSGLINLSQNPDVKTKRLVEYLSERAGLLLPRGIRVYTFPHRTFQEYLAACFLTDFDFPDKLAELLRKDPNRWREVTLLAGAKAARGSSFAIWALVDSLCYCEPENIKQSPEDIWGAHLAAQVLVESTDLAKVSDVNWKKVARVKLCLQEILSVKEFPPRERALAGVNLAHLGDERNQVMKVDDMPFCLVPASPFQMGEGEDKHQNNSLSENFWIAQYPVTQAQFQEFVENNGYKRAGFWKEAENAGVWQDGKIKGRWDDTWREKPRQYSIPFSLSNHPVVGVTWYEALAFVRWLNEVWKEQGRLPEGIEVKLPSEAEWEKAARGGLEILVKPLITPVKDLNKDNHPALETNPNPKRIYPWGNKPDPNCTNYADTGIGTTSVVGCFPTGASPYGCEEMSGNVWEWTRSLYKKYPYIPDDGREDLNASKQYLRVLRGGCFDKNDGDMRCADRIGLGTDFRLEFGFRIVLSPF